MQPTEGFLFELASFLAVRREAILNNWRNACLTDSVLKTGADLSRQEFNNRVPFILNVLEQRLRAQNEEAVISQLSAEHGLHRWQKGYLLSELIGEMQHLNHTLLTELRQFLLIKPDAAQALIATAYEYVSDISHQISLGSIEQYYNLQRIAAASRVDALEKTMAQLNEISQQRTNLLRHSSHDLRSSYGVIRGAAQYLHLGPDSEEERQQWTEMLQRNLANSHDLIVQLMDLARLEAGQEPLNIQSFDAGQLLTNLVADCQALAQEKNLSLIADGPVPLLIESDAVHLQRIVQNLVLNALEHTPSGYVSVSWTLENASRWIVSVQDSGPGLPIRKEGSLADVLTPSSESTAAYGLPNSEADAQEAAITEISASPQFGQGEGIGLSIVKALSELLRASMDIETKPGTGSLFRLRLPVHWQG